MDTDQELEEFLRLHGRNWTNPQDLCDNNIQDQVGKLDGKMNIVNFEHNNLESKVGNEITKAHPENEEVASKISPSFSHELVESG